MKELKIKFRRNLKNEISLIADFLKNEKVIIYPTDTIYGIGCLATEKKVIRRIYKIKKREKGKALLILVNSLAMAKKYCKINISQEKYLKKLWQENKKPTTVILGSRKILPKELTGEENTLAVRLPACSAGRPKSEFLIELIKKVKHPIVSTSANLSGEEYDGDPEKLKKLFKDKVDLIVDSGRLKNKPSRIINIIDIKNIKVLRK